MTKIISMKNLKLTLSGFCLVLIYACNETPKTAFNNNVISAAHPLASLAGKAMYAQGGNAFDAAVSAAFSLSVVESSMSGIGGRLQAIYRTSDGSIAGVDASTEVPIKYTPLEQKYSYGYETIGIPGVVAGLIKLQEDHGVLELNAVLAPAINYAENGYVMLPGEALRQQIAAEKIAEFVGSSHHFLKGNGTANSAGDLIIQKDLAEVLKAIAAKGRKGFYEGEVARKIVEDIQANGGIITLEDLKNYKALSSKIVDGVFKDHKVHSLYLPSFGAITVQILQILDHLPSFNSEEDWAFSNGKATEIAYEFRKKQENLDSLNLILSYEKAGELADKIDSSFSNIQTNIESDNPISFGSIDGHTTHLTAVDHFGNAVSLTQTIGPNMGSKVATKGLGFLYAVTLGGYLGDYKPGDRANSHISPTIITKDGQLILAIGAAGGSRIVPAITQVVSRHIDQKNTLERSLMLPRVYPFEDTLWIEDHDSVKDMNAVLNATIFRTKMINSIARFGRVHAVSFDSLSNSWKGAADPDWEGTTEYYVADEKN